MNVLRACAITVLASILGVLVNLLSPSGIAFIKSPPVKNLAPGEVISVTEAAEAFEQGNALFIDGRKESDFLTGHIPGALNFYAYDFSEHGAEWTSGLPYDVPLIVYCGDDDCELSNTLKVELEEAGYAGVRVLDGGWKSWVREGLPVGKE